MGKERKITVLVSESIYEAVKKYAESEGVSIDEVIEYALTPLISTQNLQEEK